MNKLLLLFIVVVFALAFADDANFRTKDSSGKSFKDAMSGLKTSTPTPTRPPPKADKNKVSSKLKMLEEALGTKTPKKTVPTSSDSNDPYDSAKFGPEMAELAKRITGESLPSFTAPPTTAEESKYKETVQERERRHRRQSSYGALLETLQSSGASTPAAKELLSKLSGDNMKQLQEDTSIYNRNPRPKFVPTVLLQEQAIQEKAVEKEAEKASKRDISKRIMENNEEEGVEIKSQDLKMKPAKNRKTNVERSENKETSNVYKVQVGDYILEVDVDRIKEFLATPQGKVVQAVVGYMTIVLVIRLLRLYKLISFTRGVINLAFFVAIAGLLGHAYTENAEPQVLIQEHLNLYADQIRFVVPRVFGVLAVLNVLAFSRLTFADTLHFALVAGVALHFRGTKLELLEAAHFLPLYLSAFSILSLLSIVSMFSSSAKPAKKEKKATMIVKEDKSEKIEAKKGKNSEKDSQAKKRNKPSKEKSEKAETAADEN